MNKSFFFLLSLLLLLCATSSCGTCRSKQTQTQKEVVSKVQSPSQYLQGKIENNKLTISQDIDLNGKQYAIPEGIELVFKGGIIKNGTLIGNKTRIDCITAAFDRVNIKGNWIVPYITTRLFADLGYTNSLCDVLALANPEIKNTIEIEDGDYTVQAEREKGVCLMLFDNTNIIINGTIHLAPNDYEGYDIIKVSGSNVYISGHGAIIGDRNQHTGSKGEFGMGIDVKGAKNISICGLSIKDCWGDCIYVGNNSKNVKVEGCNLDNARRNGISVTDADGVEIRKCRISNVRGTNPQDAIDIEPNKNCKVDHVLIDSVEVMNCVGGVIVSKGSKNISNKKIGVEKIINSKVSTTAKYPIRVKFCESAIIENNVLSGNDVNSVICVNDTPDVIIRNNHIRNRDKTKLDRSNNINNAANIKGKAPIVVIRAKKQSVSGNSIIQ